MATPRSCLPNLVALNVARPWVLADFEVASAAALEVQEAGSAGVVVAILEAGVDTVGLWDLLVALAARLKEHHRGPVVQEVAADLAVGLKAGLMDMGEVADHHLSKTGVVGEVVPLEAIRSPFDHAEEVEEEVGTEIVTAIVTRVGMVDGTNTHESASTAGWTTIPASSDDIEQHSRIALNHQAFQPDDHGLQKVYEEGSMPLVPF